MKNTINEKRAIMRVLMAETPERLRTPTDLRLDRADGIAVCVWWFLFALAAGVLVFGLLR